MSILIPAAHAEVELRDSTAHLERAVAFNRMQARALARPDTPEPDSIVELLALLRPAGRHEHDAHRELRRLVATVNGYNARERLDVERAASPLDALASGFRAQRVTGNNGGERNGHAGPLTVKAIARALRPHLRQLAETDGPHPFRAFCAVHRLIADTPRRQLLSESVAHELGAGPAGLLRELVADFDACNCSTEGAANAPGAQDAGGIRDVRTA